MIAGRKEVTFSIASSPLAATSVWKPHALTSSASPTRVAGSSSTMRTRSVTAGVSVAVSLGDAVVFCRRRHYFEV